MLVCKIEMWPKGDEAAKYELGEVRIASIGGDRHIGHYSVELMKCAKIAKKEGVWRSAKVLNFQRMLHGPYDLLLRALIACVGGRSYFAVRDVPNDTALFDVPPALEHAL